MCGVCARVIFLIHSVVSVLLNNNVQMSYEARTRRKSQTRSSEVRCDARSRVDVIDFDAQKVKPILVVKKFD